MATRKSRKKQRLRNNEYYDTQAIYDELYSKAKENRRFTNLYDLIVSRENISDSYTNLRAHETPEHLVCRLLLEKKKEIQIKNWIRLSKI